VALASVVWREMFNRQLIITPLESAAGDLSRVQAVLLIGDKVVNNRLTEFDIETDLGGAWKSLTGLPFVFAAWVADQAYEAGDLPRILEQARDTGIARAADIAANAGPGLGWPVELATRYLTHRLRFRITDKHREAMRLFLEMVQQQQLLPDVQELVFS
jgi:chorismate dehydratase